MPFSYRPPRKRLGKHVHVGLSRRGASIGVRGGRLGLNLGRRGLSGTVRLTRALRYRFGRK
ncbi:MAG: hypothetical protein MSC31_03295 [Solirubrobacteraceae bacterium MAG38_C4-C5]|nr:hypothetical protein [Candidatus Siliceabacter maunaloa]